jgi:hypothetical protein
VKAVFPGPQALLILPCQIRDSGKNFSPDAWQPKNGCFSNQLKLIGYILIMPVFYFGINLASNINTLK